MNFILNRHCKISFSWGLLQSSSICHLIFFLTCFLYVYCHLHKQFFQVQSRRLAESFEQLSTTFGARVTLVQTHVRSVFLVWNPWNLPDAKELSIGKEWCELFPENLCSQQTIGVLTRWEPAYGTFVLRFRPKTSSRQLPYQCPSSSADCTRELVKGSNRSESLLGCTRKKFSGWGLRFFCEWRISEVVFDPCCLA